MENTSKKSEVIVAMPAMVGKTIALPGGRFKMTKQVTRSVLVQDDRGTPFFVTIQGKIRLSDIDPQYSKFKDSKTGEASLPDVFDVLNLETGEYQILICNKVFSSEIQKAYADNSYVGKSFGVRRTTGKVDKRYRTYDIIEMELDKDAPGGAVKVADVTDVSKEAAQVDNAKAGKVNKA